MQCFFHVFLFRVLLAYICSNSSYSHSVRNISPNADRATRQRLDIHPKALLHNTWVSTHFGLIAEARAHQFTPKDKHKWDVTLSGKGTAELYLHNIHICWKSVVFFNSANYACRAKNTYPKWHDITLNNDIISQITPCTEVLVAANSLDLRDRWRECSWIIDL